MPVPVSPVPWAGSLQWLLELAAVSFLVPWIATDKLGMRRTPYIGVLATVTAVLRAGYVAWLRVGAVALLTANWLWGLIVAPVGRSGSR